MPIGSNRMKERIKNKSKMENKAFGEEYFEYAARLSLKSKTNKN